jgi:hypothetical protein
LKRESEEVLGLERIGTARPGGQGGGARGKIHSARSLYFSPSVFMPGITLLRCVGSQEQDFTDIDERMTDIRSFV